MVGGVAVVTCPDKQAHKDAIMSVINEKINDELETDDETLDGFSAVFGTIGTGIVGHVIDNRLNVKNHFLWSEGELQDFDGESRRVSVGVFGHVFTFSKEDIDKALENQL